MELHRRRQGLIADRRSCTNLATTTEIDYSAFDALTFDCYGTLIDWESGIIAALQPLLARAGVAPALNGLDEVQGMVLGRPDGAAVAYGLSLIHI